MARLVLLRALLYSAVLAAVTAIPGLPKDKYDLLQTQSPKLAQQLQAWWGEDVYERSAVQMQLDLMEAGYDLQYLAQDSMVDSMSMIAERHASGERCSSLPVSIASHAWRYKSQQLRGCLSGDDSSSHGWNCTLSCDLLPAVLVQLRCEETSLGEWALTGTLPDGECRHMRDSEVIGTTGGALRGLLRPISSASKGSENVSVALARTFWGIRYADPPKRFSAPEPISSKWEGIKDLDDYYAADFVPKMHCSGLPPIDDGKGSEDCLFLDIYAAPNARKDSPKPVMIFLFGGGFIAGDAWQSGHLDGIQFATRSSVVLIVLSFRVGVLGQWGHPSLTRSDGGVGNYGQLDQRVALQWVQANIHSFGGDPGAVTLAGHSSGAFGVAFHLMSPASRGLFAGAITESSSFDSGWYFQDKMDAFTFYAQLGEALGCPRDSPSAGANDFSSQIQCLRELPEEAFYNFSQSQMTRVLKKVTASSKARDAWTIIESILSTMGLRGHVRKAGLLPNDTPILASPLWPALPAGVIVDGSDAGLPGTPRALYESGRLHNVPIYVNHQKDEGTLFAAILIGVYPWFKTPSLTHEAVDIIMKWQAKGDANFSAKIMELYPHGTKVDAPFYRLSKLIQDNVFVCSTRRFAKAVSTQRPGRLFYAEETYAGSSLRSTSIVSAILHKDLAYFFGAHHCEQPRWIIGPSGAWNYWSDADQRMLDIVNCHYARMLHCGDPGASPDFACRRNLTAAGIRLAACEAEGGDRPLPAYRPTRNVRTEINPARSGSIEPSEDEHRVCEVWDAAKPDVFLSDSCHGCAQKASSDVPVLI